MLVLLLASVLAGCNSYSLSDQFSTGDERAAALGLSVDSSTIQRGGIVGLSPSGGVKPYSFAMSAADLYSGTQSVGLGSISGLTYTAGGAIGKVKITVTDSKGSAASAFVVVQPPAPTLSGSGRTSSTEALLQWSFPDTSIISSFRVERAADGQAFSAVDSPGPGTPVYRSYSDLIAGVYYTYRIYAVSGSYDSPACVVRL